MTACRNLITAGVVLSLIGGSALAEDDSYFEATGFVAGEFRLFPHDPIHDGQENQKLNASLIIQPEILYEWNGGDDRVEFIPFARLDSHDSKRTHGDIRELSYLHFGDSWDVTLGFDKVFWGVTESRHLVDIINQTDAVESSDGEEKLGQPMVNLGIQNDWGDINAFVLPYFRERTFPGVNGRLRSSLVVDTDQAVYQSSKEEKHTDFALRYETVLGDWDIGLAHFRGTSRDPRFEVGTSSTGDTVLVPHYDLMDRTSFDVQATIEEWLWKVEGIYEQADYDNFAAFSAGFEYTFFGLVNDAGDLGVLAEYHYDGRDSDAPSTFYDNDLFFGGRVTLNDVNNTNFLAGVLYDPNTRAKYISVEADTRLTDFWSIEVEANFYQDVTSEELLYEIRQDDHIQMLLTRYF